MFSFQQLFIFVLALLGVVLARPGGYGRPEGFGGGFNGGFGPGPVNQCKINSQYFL